MTFNWVCLLTYWIRFVIIIFTGFSQEFFLVMSTLTVTIGTFPNKFVWNFVSADNLVRTDKSLTGLLQATK